MNASDFNMNRENTKNSIFTEIMAAKQSLGKNLDNPDSESVAITVILTDTNSEPQTTENQDSS